MGNFRWLCLLFVLFLFPCYAANEQPLLPDQAFAFSAKMAGNHVIALNWIIAPGHYLYQNRLSFNILQPKTASLAPVELPPGLTKTDNIFGTYQIYSTELKVPLTILLPGNGDVVLKVTYQGCSESGYCYPPTSHRVTVNFTQNTLLVQAGAAASPLTPAPAAQTSHDKILNLLLGKHLFSIIFGFIGFGLLLAFTPCVLPMIPILSGIILGHGRHLSTRKAFALSSIYVLSMSFTYAIAGIIAAYIGNSIQAAMQKPWVILTFSLVFILLALSLFGLYNLQPPRKLEAYLATISGHQKKGSYLGVAIMGCLGTLIVSPCVTPALIAALSYIGQTGNALIGGLALFCTGLGMGLPLLLIVTSGAKWLPKTGHWMIVVKAALGVLLLGMAILMLSRILPGSVVLFLWALLLIGCAVYMGALNNGTLNKGAKLWRGLGVAVLVYGIMLMIGAALGNNDPLQPFGNKNPTMTSLAFQPIKKTSDLTQAFATAKTQNKPVLLDFYADWCISCKEMDHNTFAKANVQDALKNFIVLRADITNDDAADQELLHQYNVIAPPTILFFNPDGAELKNLRIIGEKGPQQFLQRLQDVQSALATAASSTH